MGISTKQLIINGQKYYKTLKSIYSPAIKTTIQFNRHGWNHILYDSRDHRRTEQEIRLRLHLLANVLEVIQQSTTKPTITEKILTISKSKIKVSYIEIDHHIRNGQYIKVIIRKFPKGEYHYFSVRRGRINKKSA